MIKYLNINSYYKNANIVKENENDNFDDILKKIKKNTYIQGYWQNVNFLKDVKNIMREEIVLLNPSNLINDLLIRINNANSCSIHIRRGDYLKKPFDKIYNVCSDRYYHEGLKVVEKKISNPFYFIFTDDIGWAKNIFKDLKNKIYISDLKLNDYEEFYLLSKCKSHIISNSTFSLIGAWLNSDKNLIIEPKNWFKLRDSGNKLLDEWVKLEN